MFLLIRKKIYEAKDGGFRANIYYQVAGEKKVKYFHATDYRSMIKKINDFINNYDLDNNKSMMLYGRFIKELFLPHKKKQLKISSYSRLNSIYRNHCSDFDDIPLKYVTSEHIFAVLDAKKDANISKSVLDKIYDFFNSSFNYAIQLDYISRNPLFNIKKYKSNVSRKVIRIYSQPDLFKLEALLENYKASSWKYSIPVLWLTGLRIGELLALNKNDIDLQNKVINVRANYIYIHDDDIQGMRKDIVVPKTSSAIRTVPLPDKAMPYVIRLLEYYPGSYFIATSTGNRVSPRNYSRLVRGLCAFAGVEFLGVHAFRHTYATNLIDNGVNVKIVSELLGHSSVTMTMQMYVHTNIKSKFDAVNTLQ